MHTLGLGGLHLAVDVQGQTHWPADLAFYRTDAPGPAQRRLTVVARPGWRNPHLPTDSMESNGLPLGVPLESARDRRGGTATPPGVAHRLDRWDLAFEAAPDGDRAWTDGSAHALEAAVQLSLTRLLLAHGGLLLHASAGVDDAGCAWLIPGPSGAGKTTAARTAGFARVLSDELPMVVPGEGGYVVWPSPFWSAGRAAPLQRAPAPLRVLARPGWGPRPRARPLDRAAAAAWLMACVAWYDDAPAERAQAFERACDIAAAAPECVALTFPKEGPWLSAVQRQS
ncbi:MAG: hypothetical protein H6702_05525 [Myxococcales bacterium]|nr:hypothetical protein [Myxococcales bacterium]